MDLRLYPTARFAAAAALQLIPNRWPAAMLLCLL